MDDIASVDASSIVERGQRKGASGGRKMGRTTGEKTDEFSWSLYRVGLRKLLRGLLPLAPSRGAQKVVGLVFFDVTVQHAPPSTSEDADSIYEYRAKGCLLNGITFAHAEGPDADQVDVPLDVTELTFLIDGIEVVLL